MLAVERLKKLQKRQSASSGHSRDSTPISSSGPRWSADMAANGHYMGEIRAQCRSSSGENLSLRQSRESSPYSMAASKSVNEIMHLRYCKTRKYSYMNQETVFRGVHLQTDCIRDMPDAGVE